MLKTIIRLFRSAIGFSDCPCCKTQSVRFHMDNPIHPDGPPIFQWWACGNCGASTEIEGTWLMNDAARSFGFRDFGDFAEQRFGPRATASPTPETDAAKVAPVIEGEDSREAPKTLPPTQPEEG